MNHDERMQFAHDITIKMAKKHPILLCGIYGSTVRGTDTQWSDLELLIIARGKMESRSFLCKGIAAGYTALDEEDLISALTTPTEKWPFWMGVLSVLKVLYGDQAKVKEWLKLGMSVPDEKFKTKMAELLPGFIVESYGRILSCQERNNSTDIYISALEVIFEMRDALCLLNRRWVTHDYYEGILETFAFPKLPQRYTELIPRLWNSREPAEIVPTAKELVDNFWKFVAEEGIEVHDFQSADEIEV